jgi:signal transduction histidine kinase
MMAGMIENSFILVITLTALVVQALFREHMIDIQDISESNKALTERVALRTAELERMNEALKAAKHSAEQANASRTRFLVAASHGLRQALQVLTTHTDMLLDNTRLETGDIPHDLPVFPVSSLLEELRKQHTLPATEYNLSFRFNNCDRHIRSDYNLLRLILQNLISNAIRCTDSDDIEVNCIVQDDMLRIAVIDTGIGIPDTERKMIFEEFDQIDNPARERVRVTGMGMAIAG